MNSGRNSVLRGLFWCLWIVTLAPGTNAADTVPGQAYRVRIEHLQDVDTLEAAGLSVGAVQSGYAVVHPAPGQESLLDDLGFSAVPLPTPKTAVGYPSREEVSAWIADRAVQFPNLCQVVRIGTSVQGHPVEVIRITDQPGVEEDEPEARLISTIHGNEALDTVLLLRLLDDLLLGYGSDPRITTLINETNIALLPLMNPDGYAANTRYNALGIDLNRHFPAYPDEFTGSQATGEPLHDEGRQPETAAVMQWSADNRFVVSANLHTGALVVNYPYDDDGYSSGTYAASPDDGLYRVLSSNYANSNPYMLEDSPFPGGIVNGSAWYVIDGGLMDWSYRYTGCLEVTLELSETYAPAPSLWDAYHLANSNALIGLLESAHWGIRGVVTDQNSGLPLDATVTLQENGQVIMTDPDVGDFHRPMLPGTYTLAVSAKGYQTYHSGPVVVNADSATRVDIALAPVADTDPEVASCPMEALLVGQHKLLGTLRMTRDKVMAMVPGGRTLVQAYYAHAPAWTPAARALRAQLDTLISHWPTHPGLPASPIHG